MFVIKNESTVLFTDINAKELSELQDVIKHVVDRTKDFYADQFDGYNLFSNNGTARIGQTYQQFHMHIFLRLKNEEESPFTVMNERRNWAAQPSEQWQNNRDELIKLLR